MFDSELFSKICYNFEIFLLEILRWSNNFFFVFSILVVDNPSLQFVADIRWIGDGYLYILSSRFQKYFLRTVDPHDVNVRIMRIPLGNVKHAFLLPHNPQYPQF